MNTQQLRQKILDLAIRGQLVPQDENDEPAQVLLERIRAEKQKNLPQKGKKKSDDKSPYQNEDELTEFPFQIPENWAWCRLGEIIKISSGKNLTISKMDGKGYPVYGGNGITGYHSLFNIEKQTIVIGRVGFYCGSIHITKKKAWITDNAFITSFNEYYLNINWLYNLLKFLNLGKKSNSSAQPVISTKSIYNITVPLPPLQEQHRIVSKIEEIFTLIDNIEQNQSDLKSAIEQTKAKVLDMAIHGKLLSMIDNKKTSDNEHYTENLPKGWKKYELSELCSFENGYAFSSEDYTDNGTYLIRISNLQNGKVDLSDAISVKIEVDKKFVVQKGDLLIAMSGATTGKMGIYHSDKKAFLNQRVGNIRVIDEEKLFPKYRNYFMLTKSDEILKMAYGGAQPNISGKMINSLIIPLPPLKEQKEIVKKIEEVFLVLEEIEANIYN